MLVWMRFGLALLLLPCACSKSGQSDKLPPMQIQGVNVDIPKLSAEFTKAPPEISSRVSEGIMKVRMTQYLQGMVIFDELSNDPKINEKQKKLLIQINEQLKEVVSKTSGAR